MVTSAGPIAREPAQREARRELSRGMYHQTSVTQKIVHAISSFLNKIFSGAGHATPGGWWTLVALVAVVVLVVAVILTRTGPLAGAARRTAPPGDLGPGPLTARQCRAAAEEAAAGGDYGTAILQRLRAVAFSLEERRVLHPDTGRTADEVAAQAGARFPDHAAALAGAARLFDRIRFGDGTGTRDGYERMKALDDLLARTAPAAPAQSPAAVPA